MGNEEELCQVGFETRLRSFAFESRLRSYKARNGKGNVANKPSLWKRLRRNKKSDAGKGSGAPSSLPLPTSMPLAPSKSFSTDQESQDDDDHIASNDRGMRNTTESRTFEGRLFLATNAQVNQL